MERSAPPPDFRDVIAKTYKEQAIFFLNAFWLEHKNDAEQIWQYNAKMVELDQPKGKEGCELDEFNSHRFLEHWGETKTVVKLRELLMGIGLNRNKKMSLIEYLLCKYNRTVNEALARPQGTGTVTNITDDLIKAQRALDDVNSEIQKIEKRKAELEAVASGTGVRAGSAKAELASLLDRDNTDLNRALLTAEAALRKAGGSPAPPGLLYWMGRELEEMKKYRPQSKGGVSRT